MRNLTAALKAIPKEMAALDHEISRAELLAAQQLVERLGRDAKVRNDRKRLRYADCGYSRFIPAFLFTKSPVCQYI